MAINVGLGDAGTYDDPFESDSFGSRRVEAVTPVATSAIQTIDAEINDAR